MPTVTIQKTSSGTLNPVDEDGQVEFGYAVTSSDQRHDSIRTFGPTPPTSASVYSEGFNTARSSMATMVEQIPTSATALLSTFHNQQNHNPLPSHIETNTQARSYHLPIPPVRKSSVVYIKSDENAPTVAPTIQNDFRASKPEQWPASAKRHIPRAPKTISPDGSPSPLRKLTLLGNRDLNRNGSGDDTPPLAIPKKTRKPADKENPSNVLRPLKLARSATAKARGLLRQGEVLPDVIVRPPSSSDHTGFGYTFR